jgi:hypothetical protein
MIELLCPYLLCNKGFGQILSFKDEGMRGIPSRWKIVYQWFSYLDGGGLYSQEPKEPHEPLSYTL